MTLNLDEARIADVLIALMAEQDRAEYHGNDARVDYLQPLIDGIRKQLIAQQENKIPDWTGEYVKKLHLSGFQKKDVASHMGYSPEYVGRVLSGKERPRDAAARFNNALDELLAEKELKR
jgi:hypothetical protein